MLDDDIDDEDEEGFELELDEGFIVQPVKGILQTNNPKTIYFFRSDFFIIISYFIISSIVGREEIAPFLQTQIEEATCAKSIDSSILLPFDINAAKVPLKQSPAAVVSIACTTCAGNIFFIFLSACS